ncbi:uncharacterized protein LOC144904305 isoform X3 [Branchiostoma floridae x Branchiostoma belcheri]
MTNVVAPVLFQYIISPPYVVFVAWCPVYHDLGLGFRAYSRDATQQTTQVPTTTTTRYTTDQTTQRPTLPGTSDSQNTTNQGTQRSALPGTTVSRYTTDQTTQQPTLPGTTIVSQQQATNQTTTPAGCAVGVGSVLLYIYGKRRQRSRQVAQDLQD